MRRLVADVAGDGGPQLMLRSPAADQRTHARSIVAGRRRARMVVRSGRAWRCSRGRSAALADAAGALGGRS